MEKINKHLTGFFLILSLVLPFSFCYAQEMIQDEQIRIYIWSDLDPYPGNYREPEGKVSSELAVFEYAIERSKEIAPFLMNGMIYGWSFDYTPSDKMRNVSEYFDFKEVQPFNPKINPITFHSPEVKEDRLESWAYCTRTPVQTVIYERWKSINHPKIKGKGTGSIEDGFEGIKNACAQAVKNAVRTYYQQQIKNKPKEIEGNVLLIKQPRIYIKNGQYVVDLDFFMETDTIKVYTYY